MAMMDRSKRYDKSAKKGGTAEKVVGEAGDTAARTAGSPPTNADPKGAIHMPDGGPSPGSGPAFGEVAERHKTEMGEMHKRHASEMSAMHERHAKEHGDMGKRHGKEMAPNADEAGAMAAVGSGGKGPKLGATENKGAKGTEP